MAEIEDAHMSGDILSIVVRTYSLRMRNRPRLKSLLDGFRAIQTLKEIIGLAD
jgi:hypothetical protein